MKRDGKDYQTFIDRAYQAMYDQCESFRKALATTGKAVITHSIGKTRKARLCSLSASCAPALCCFATVIDGYKRSIAPTTGWGVFLHSE